MTGHACLDCPKCNRLEELASLLAEQLMDHTGRRWGIGYSAGRPFTYEWTSYDTPNLTEADTWAELIAWMQGHLARLGQECRGVQLGLVASVS